MSTFDEEMAAADAAIFLGLGELASALDVSSGLITPDVSVIVERDLEVILGDVPSLGTALSYQPGAVEGLGAGDRFTLGDGEILQLVRRLSGDAGEVTWIVINPPPP